MGQRQKRAMGGKEHGILLAVLPLVVWGCLCILHLSQVLCDLRELTLPLLTSRSASEQQNRRNSRDHGFHAVWCLE